ncbi:MAG: hypothetical protein HYX26_04500 [Acidobacteriales bacterium]|nr:hypothetical protein [Terriglobales bacterium]
MRYLLATLFLCSAAFSQQSSETTISGRTSRQDAKAPPIAERYRLWAKKALETAEAEAGGFEAPSRTFLWYQAARGLGKTDKNAARDLLMRALTASEEIQDDTNTQEMLQGWIVRQLLPYGLDTAQEILPRVKGDARSTVREALVRAYVKKKDFDSAIALVSAVRSDEDEFPFDSVSQLLIQLPEERAGEKNQIFAQALAFTRAHPAKPGAFSSEDLGSFVVRFFGILPKNMVLEAIDELLDQAQAGDEKRKPIISISGNDKGVSFRSMYEYRLFQVLPAVRALDPSRAEKLVQDNQLARQWTQQYPQGMATISPHFLPNPPSDEEQRNNRLSFDISDSADNMPVGEDEGALNARIREIVKSAEKNPRQALAATQTLPGMYRADALDSLANALLKKDPMVAKDAALELVKAVEGLHINAQRNLLANAVRHLNALGDKDAAIKAAKRGMDLGRKLFEDDQKADKPNTAMHPLWPSSAYWQVFIGQIAKISPEAAIEAVNDVNDPEIRVFQKISLANQWMGIPTGLVVSQIKRKGGDNSLWINSSDDEEN